MRIDLYKRQPYERAGASVADVRDVIKSLGFYKTKAKHCVEAARMIVADYGGEVPSTMRELQKLPGVGRKTANIVLNVGFGIVEGIAVDTHVNRIAHRLALSPKTHEKEPLKTEQDLLKILPPEYWESVNHQWISFGRAICSARSPKCAECPLADLCPSCTVSYTHLAIRYLPAHWRFSHPLCAQLGHPLRTRGRGDSCDLHRTG